MFAALLLAAAPLAVNRVEILAIDDPVYAALNVPAAVRTHPDSATRLVVFRDGVPVLDRGLVSRRTASTAEDPAIIEERGFVEDAAVAPDRSAALVRQTRFTGRMAVGTGQEPATLQGRERLTWIDPDRPGGRWSVDLPEGRFVREMVVAPLASGAAAILTDGAGLGGEFRLFDAAGKEIALIAPPGAEAVDAAAADDVPVVAIDVAYPARAGLPDRAIVVFDLTAGTRWEHEWKYGSDDEPKSWSLDADGSLVLQVPGGVRRFDRGGKSASPPAKGHGPFNRLRGDAP
jgi:hypothetical protein